MLRTFQGVISKPANTMYKAAVDMVTGMGVVSDESTMLVSFPATEMGSGISLVDKERVPTGLNAGRGDMSDYDEDFTKIKAGEPVKLMNYVAMLGRLGVDQFNDAGLAINNMVAVGTDGLWKKATVPSLYQYIGKYDDAGNALIKIRVLDAPQEN